MESEETIMKLMTPLGIGVLSLLLGAPAVMCAQDDKPRQEEPKPEDKAREVKPEDRTKEVKPEEKRDEEKRNDMKPQDAKPEDMKRNDARQEEHPEARPQDRPEARQEAGRPAGKHVDRIPDDKFRSNFGREHVTVINRTTIVEGRPSFQFGGYWFGLSAGWPVGWTYSDQVYVDYIDGEYFLFNVLHPGVRVALIVTM
jgi:hypothetical protein